MNSVPSEKYGLSPDEIEILAKDLEHFLIFTKQKKQNWLTIDLTGTIRKKIQGKKKKMEGKFKCW